MLQGSLGDFSLAELLGLIATTQKTGQLRLDGDRGSGSLWLDAGALVAADATRGPGAIQIAAAATTERSVEDIVFELLRFADGTFSFSLGIAPPEHGVAEDVDVVLHDALGRLDEWRGIEAIVPSLLHVLLPVPALPAEQVTIGQDEWAIIVSVGERAEVRAVCEALDLDEVAGSRQIKAMVERSLLSVTPPGATPIETIGSVATPFEARTPVAVPIVTAEPAPVVAPPSATPLSDALLSNALLSDAAASTSAVVESPPEATPEPTVSDPAVISVPAPTHVSAAADEEAAVDDEAERPPMPTPPSPAEIESFGQQLDEEPFDPTSLVTDDDSNGSLLMRYLKSDS